MLKTLFVVDSLHDHTGYEELKTISFDTYLHDYPKLNKPHIRIINLCNTERYLGQGYYCSLLAEARHHAVLPSIKVINQLRSGATLFWLDKSILATELDLSSPQVICMGESIHPNLQKLASKVFRDYPAPVLIVNIEQEKTGLRLSVKSGDINDLDGEDKAFCTRVLESYASKLWRKQGKGKKYRWDIAMLVNEEEKVPPSNKGALSRFIKAGENLGIKVRMLAYSDLHFLNQYDGLFIRETTAIDHHTYRLASEAELQGLVVIDDSTSILRCCNKVFLHDAFNYRKVPSLKTIFVSDTHESSIDKLESELGYPMVLKMPESSFSKGVFKVEDRDKLLAVLADLLQQSSLILAQEYLFTEYDWRIGVLNGRALYACRYYMARNHWQIYNHSSKRFFAGGFDSLPTFEVPRKVLDVALQAAALVGNGLYGIDIKEADNRAYVLEVNDNPSIDHGVEDKYLGEEIYMQIMSEFLRRLEARGR